MDPQSVEGNPFAPQPVGNNPFATPAEPLPQAFQDRMASGAAVAKALNDHVGFDPMSMMETGPHTAFWPERMARSALSLGKDVMDGTVLTGPGLRKEDFSDDPDAPEPLDTLIQRAQDLSAFAFPSTSFAEHPIVMTKGGQAARLVSDADGTMKGQTIGPPPKPEDFKAAASVIKGPEAEANLQAAWQEKGLHPAEVAQAADDDAWVKHDIATNPDRGTTSDLAKTGDPRVDTILNDKATKAAIDNPVVNRDNDVPYSAGPDKKGNGLNIDRNFPHQMTVDGITFDPAEPLGVHEFTERDVMNRLTKGGMDEDAAYRVAHFDYADPAENTWYTVHGLDPEKVNTAYQPFIDSIDHENPASPPPDLFEKPYGHGGISQAGRGPVEATAPSEAERAQANAILNTQAAKPVEPPEAPLIPLDKQPAPAAGKLVTLAQQGINAATEIGRDIQMLVSPMTRGTKATMAIVKDTANALRRIRWEWARTDNDLVKRFTPEQRKEMWERADEESVLQATAAIARPQPQAQPQNNVVDLVDRRNAASFLRQLGHTPEEDPEFFKDPVKWAEAAGWGATPEENEQAKASLRAMGENPDNYIWPTTQPRNVQTEGKTDPEKGLSALAPELRVAVEREQEAGMITFAKAKDLGMIKGEGLPSYTPRAMVNLVDRTAGNKPAAINAKSGVRTTATGMLERKYLTAGETEAAGKGAVGEEGQLVRDIRILPLKRAELENAIAGRQLINNIEEYGAQTGFPTVVRGNLPPGANAKDWFTLDHPAFKSWEPIYERDAHGEPILEGNSLKTVKNEDGDVMFNKVPLHVHKDFEGPLQTILNEKSDATYKALMAIKGKSMSLIMNSPLIHNVVEWSRALPAMPLKVITLRAYFEGNAAKNNPAVMHEFLDNGLVPIGKRFFNQDINAIMESPDLTPGRSTTAKIAGFIPGLFSEGAEVAVKQAIDKAGDFWHNTLLWDRVADLQMGLAVNFQRDAIAAGFDRVTATRYAAHFANRFAGSLPQEAMSTGARKLSNLLMFSRTYTLGNIGVMKDAVTGLPGDVSAQILRDAGPDVLAAIKSKARRMAVSTVALDIGLAIVGGSLLQNVFNVANNDSSWPQEFRGYIRRLQGMKDDVLNHPLSMLLPWNAIAEAKKISATADNEPGKQDRIRIGSMKDGTGIYGTNPAGRIGNEFMDYMTGPLDQMKRKMGTFAKPTFDILANDRGFGRKVYDPNALENGAEMQAAINIAKTVAESQAPTGQVAAFGKLVTSPDDKGFNALQMLGPLLGTNVSRGAPGGPAVGDYYHAKEMQQFQIEKQTQEIRDLIKSGDLATAQQRMQALGMNKSYQKWMVKTTQNPALRFNPKTAQELYQFLTPAQRDHMMNQGK